MMAPRRSSPTCAKRMPAGAESCGRTTTKEDLPKKGKRGGRRGRRNKAYWPEPMAALVFVSGPLDGAAGCEAAAKHADVVDCGTLHDPGEAAMWITKRLEKDELTIEPKAISLLLATTGLTLGRIRPEIEKLVLYAAGESIITVAHVRDLVVPQEESEGTFALMDAVQNSNAPRALREVSALIESGVQPPVILGQLRAATIRLRGDARVKSGLEAVFRTDIAIKSSSGTPQYLLEALVVELCAR
jgi:DNA polymerase III delta subunit